MTEQNIFAAVRAYYGSEAVVLSQVGNATGAGHRRLIDALAVGIWPSRGLYLHAIEIKISKSDLMRELKNPEKADEIARFCDKFFIAAPFIPPEGVPNAWGWYTVGDGVARRMRDAAAIEAQPLNRSFVAAIARRLVEQQAPEVLLAEAEERGRVAGRAESAAEIDRLINEANVAYRKAATIESSMRGVDVDAVRQMKEISRNLHGQRGSLNALRMNAAELVRQADALEELAKRVLVGEQDGT